MEIVIFPNYKDLSQRAAKVVAGVVRTKPDAVLGFATGATPLGTYAELIHMHKEEGLDYSQITTFNLDEYVGLPPDHFQSYHSYMFDNLFDHINVPRDNIHIPSGTAPDLEEYCTRYEQLIKESGGIDLQILGIGGNGHIAFNEPGSPFTSRTRVVNLAEQTINDNSRFFENREEVPTRAVSMGIATILEARKILLIVDGRSKADALAAALEGPITEQCPASVVQQHPNLTVLADEKAAEKLQNKRLLRASS